jgi:hypothetical protein
MSRTAFPRLMLNLAAAALLTGTVAGQAQADTIWRFPYKGAPYAVPHEHNGRIAIGQNTRKPKAVHAREAKRTHVAGSPAVVR